MRRLRAYVHVKDPSGAMVAFGPNDVVPDWAAEQIVNPKAWDTAPEEASAPIDAPASVTSASTTPPRAGDDLPPKGGPGSGLDAWLDYARAHGIAVPDEAGRDDVIAAVAAARQS